MMARLETMMQNNQEKMEAWIDVNNDKFDVFRSTPISWVDMQLARTDVTEEEIIAQMDAHQERMVAYMNVW
jgi:hypothetical protein